MNAIRAMGIAALLAVLPAATHAGAATTVVSYEPNGKLIFLPVTIDGVYLWFTLDSGARHTVIDSTTARRLHLQILSSDRDRGAGAGTYRRGHAAPLDVFIAGVRLHVADPWIIDLAGTGTAKRQDGLLGADFLAAHIVSIDPMRRLLTIYGSDGDGDVKAGSAIPLKFADNRLFVPMRLSLSNGVSASRTVRIDTGSEDAVSDDLVKQSPQRRETLEGVGLGHPYYDYSGVFASVRLGPYVVRNVWGPSNASPAVGMEILRRFTMTFDVSHRKLYIEPNKYFRDPVPSPPP